MSAKNIRKGVKIADPNDDENGEQEGLNQEEDDDLAVKKPFDKKNKKNGKGKAKGKQVKIDDDEEESEEEIGKAKGKGGSGDVKNETERTIKVADPKMAYGSNAISTNKYSIITFVPLNLYEQFTKPANLYFLVIAILQCIPDVSITNQIPTILLPLIFVVVLTAVKDLFEDLKRYFSDREENNSKTNVLRKDRPRAVTWDSLYPGDIIQIKDGDKIPADCLLFYSSAVHRGCCYVETKNLDGETNLKRKSIINTPEKISEDNAIDYLNNFVNSKIIYEKENPNLNFFKGTLELVGTTVPLNMEHLLLRGCSLKNTDYVYCVVIYTG